jgi:hypothetical protein
VLVVDGTGAEPQAKKTEYRRFVDDMRTIKEEVERPAPGGERTDESRQATLF